MNYLLDKNITFPPDVTADEMKQLFETEIFQPVRKLEEELGTSELLILCEMDGIGCMGIEASDDAVAKLRMMGYTLHEEVEVYACDE